MLAYFPPGLLRKPQSALDKPSQTPPSTSFTTIRQWGNPATSSSQTAQAAVQVAAHRSLLYLAPSNTPELLPAQPTAHPSPETRGTPAPETPQAHQYSNTLKQVCHPTPPRHTTSDSLSDRIHETHPPSPRYPSENETFEGYIGTYQLSEETKAGEVLDLEFSTCLLKKVTEYRFINYSADFFIKSFVIIFNEDNTEFVFSFNSQEYDAFKNYLKNEHGITLLDKKSEQPICTLKILDLDIIIKFIEIISQYSIFSKETDLLFSEMSTLIKSRKGC